ncbi:MAG TPA: hypothetical protein VGD58_21430 [Herpetosiphonaceae bacterium]
MSITPALAAAPANDDFASAQAIAALPFSATLNTAEATFAEDDPPCSSSSATVWYSFTPTEDMGIEANTFGSNYDTTLSVYSSSGGLSQLACNDDTDGQQSRVRVAVTGGVTYYFMIAAYHDSSGGELVFSVKPFPLPEPLTLELQLAGIATVDRQSGTATVNASLTCSRPANVSLNGLLSQQILRNTFVQGYSHSETYCSGTIPLSFNISSDQSLSHFGRGPAKFTLYADSFDHDWDRLTSTEAHARIILIDARN